MVLCDFDKINIFLYMKLNYVSLVWYMYVCVYWSNENIQIDIKSMKFEIISLPCVAIYAFSYIISYKISIIFSYILSRTVCLDQMKLARFWKAKPGHVFDDTTKLSLFLLTLKENYLN